jgi:hypothetical protein
LFEVGAAADINKVGYNGITPMWNACHGGHLSVCKWLHSNGAVADITKADDEGYTPMHNACQEGHLSVCKWLFDVGAANDIAKADNYGNTPIDIAFCICKYPSVCKWLVINGSMLLLPSLYPSYVSSDVLDWAHEVIAVHHIFSFVFLLGTYSNKRHGSKHLWKLPSSVIMLIADLSDVVKGRQLRNVRQFLRVTNNLK